MDFNSSRIDKRSDDLLASIPLCSVVSPSGPIGSRPGLFGFYVPATHREVSTKVIVDTSQLSVQVRGKESKRRFRTVGEKRRIVEGTLEPGASVARVARAHGVNANQVFAWRRQYRQGLLSEKNGEPAEPLPVHVSGATIRKAHRAVRQQATQRTTEAGGAVYVELPKRHLRVTGRVDAEALRAVREQLLG